MFGHNNCGHGGMDMILPILLLCSCGGGFGAFGGKDSCDLLTTILLINCLCGHGKDPCCNR